MLVESFIQHLRYERNYSSHTVFSYQKDLEQFEKYILWQEGMFDPLVMESAWVRGWVVCLMESGYSPSSVNRKLSSLKSFYKFLQKKGLLASSPVRLVSGPKLSRRLPGFVKEADMEALLDESVLGDSALGEMFDDVRDKLILDVFYSTGIRRFELISLRNGDVDLGACQIKVTGKRNKQRIVPFGDKLKQHIVLYIAERRKIMGGEDLVDAPFFVRKNGVALTPSFVYTMVKKQLAFVDGISRRSPHVLRHTFATTMLNNGASLNAVKEVLGHASLASTEVYTHTSFEELKKSYGFAHPRS